MTNTRNALQTIRSNVDESMGVRTVDIHPELSPVASAKDIGRRPLRTFGQVEIDRIMPDGSQPRREFNEKEIARLASSIRNMGQLHPIRIRWDAEVEKWIIITGERRWRATKAAGLTHIDCYFHDDDVTQSEVLEQQLVENLLRQDLNPLEEARGYASLMQLNGWNGRQIADALRVSSSKVSRALALLQLPDDLQQQVRSGVIPPTSAYELTKIENEAAQRDLAEQLAASAMTRTKAVNAVRQRRGKKIPRSRGIRLSFSADNGIRVSVSSRRKGTYHEIEEAILQALEEVRHRITNRVQLF
jgi:ParB family chromosome partitioning protein